MRCVHDHREGEERAGGGGRGGGEPPGVWAQGARRVHEEPEVPTEERHPRLGLE